MAGDQFYSQIIANRLLQLKQYMLTAIRCCPILYSKARFILLAGLNQIFLAIGELKYRIMAGLLMKSIFADFKKSLFHISIRVYKDDFSY